MFCCREQGNKDGEGGTQKEVEAGQASNKVETGGAEGKGGGGAQNTSGMDEEQAAGASSILR